MQHSPALLECRDLTAGYGPRPAVQGVGFAVRPGETLAVVGGSGSGKSTLLRAVAGLLAPGGRVLGGRVWLAGRELTALPERELRRVRGAQIGFVFQDAGASLCPVRTVGSQVCETLAAHGRPARAAARARALALLADLGCADPQRLWDARAFELSGGQAQRAALALAMLPQPPLLLADEPTSALDTLARRETLDQLRRLRQRYGTALVLVTHDMAVAAALADSVLVLQNGRAVEYGPAARVLRAPRHAYTRILLQAAPTLRR